MNVAVAGLGFMGTTHLEAWSGLTGVRIAAIICRDPSKLEGGLTTSAGNLDRPSSAIDLSGVRLCSRLEDVLADSSVDAVDICLPTYLHEQAAIAALQAGKHVLVEKPMALDSEGCMRMLEAARHSGRLLMAAQVLRFWPDYQPLVDAHRSGRQGKIRSCLFRRRCAAPVWGKWLQDPARSGGGVFDLLIHDVDFAVHLFGVPDAVSATGVEDLPAGIDLVNAHLHYYEGPDVLITGGWHHAGAYPFSMEYTASFDAGTIEFSTAGRPVTFYGTGEAQPLVVPAEDGFRAELSYFKDCVVSGGVPRRCPPEESAEAVRIMEFITQSRKQNGERMACSQ